MGSGHVFVMLRSRVMVFAPISGYPSNASGFACTPMVLLWVEVHSFLLVFLKICPSCSHQPFNLIFGHSLNFQGTLCNYLPRNMGHFTHLDYKVASSSWFAHFDLRNCGDAQLLGCPHPVNHTSIPLIFQYEFDWSKVLYWR